MPFNGKTKATNPVHLSPRAYAELVARTQDRKLTGSQAEAELKRIRAIPLPPRTHDDDAL